MFRDEGPKLPIENVNMILNNGGAGDIVACFPVLSYVLKYQTNVIPHVHVPNYMKQFTKTVFPTINVYGFTESKTKLKETGNFAAAQTLQSHVTNMRMHSTDYAFMTLLDKQVPDQYKDYVKYPVGSVDISRFNLPKDFVVVNTGFTIPSKAWPAQEVNKVVKWLLSKNITPVFLGKDDIQEQGAAKQLDDPLQHAKFVEEVQYSSGMDLRNQTDLCEATEILAKSKAFVGLDGGLFHLAACTDVPIVVGFTFVDPRHIVPFRDGKWAGGIEIVLPDELLKCTGCQSNWAHLYNFSFRTCWYDDYLCAKQMTGEKFIDKLEQKL